MLTMLILAEAAHAHPANEVTTEFYADAAKTKLVGESILSCGGGRRHWGVQTGFSDQHSDPCDPRHGVSLMKASQLLLHHDPHQACLARCKRENPLRICAPNEDCGAGLRQCDAACDDLLTPQE